jgi:cytochrome c oxidase subunit 2
MWDFPLFPERASTIAVRVDSLYQGLLLLAIFFTLLIFCSIAFFAVRYRAGSKASRAHAGKENFKLELAWTIIPVGISLGIYVWAANLYYDMHVAPPDAVEIYVIGKQWMWKIQHPQGNREINELHIPVGRPIKLIMTSQDVIHSFFIPAFRVKQDVLPGRYSTEWFEATKTGEYHLFCAQYCGTSHASMTGKIIVMKQPDYQQWLAGNLPGETMASTGDQVFQQFGCSTCHKQYNLGRGPSLQGLFGSTVHLQGGGIVIADQEYIRESILSPSAKVVEGYTPIMPTFRNQVTAEQVSQLVEYIKSLGGKGSPDREAAR